MHSLFFVSNIAISCHIAALLCPSVFQSDVQKAGERFDDQIFPLPASLPTGYAARLHSPGTLSTQLHEQDLQPLLPTEAARYVKASDC